MNEMDDLISRQVALDAVYDAFCYAYCDNCEKEMNEDLCGDCHRKYQNWSASKKIIKKVINNLPSAQQWIPCSERLPEEADGTVLVCMPNESPYNGREPFINAKHNQRVETATYSQYSDTWYFAMGAVSETRPVAWMPLPEPWKGEENDESRSD